MKKHPLLCGKHRGLFINLLSALAFYFATFFLKLGAQLDDSISHIYVYTRYLSGTFIIGLFIVWRGQFFIPADARKFVLWRSVFNILAVLAFYKAVELGNTGQANVLNMTYPIFVVLLSGPILGEKPKPTVFFLILIALIGVILNFPFFESRANLQLEPIVYGLLSAVIAALAIISLRGAVQKTKPETVMFWMFLSGTIAITPFAIESLVHLKSNHYLYLLLSSLSGITGQWLLARSYLYLDAPTGSIVSSTRIPIALVFGWLLLQEVFYWNTLYGAILIALANVLLALHSNKQKSVKQSRF